MKIFAVGMNYAGHNKTPNETLSGKEMPVIFTKADSALLKDGKPFFIPDDLGTIEYETELVVRICRLGKTIPERFAHRYYDAVTVGIDFTARELQQKLREQGIAFLQSNSHCEQIIDLYKDFKIKKVRAKRAINSRGDRRGEVDEVLISG